MALSATQRAETKAIASELARIARSGQVLAGTISERRTSCGNPNCRCMADPPERHGPYYQWTRKLRAKTVGTWLSPAERDVYQAWIENHRRMRELLARLEDIGEEALRADRSGSRL